MSGKATSLILAALICLSIALSPVSSANALQSALSAQTPAAMRSVGAIKSIAGNSITLIPDSGEEISIAAQDDARILQIAPGEKDLKNAIPIKMADLQVGDRILVRGAMSNDGRTLNASSVIAIKKTALAERQKNELQDWQKRGMGGLVKSVDPATGILTITTTLAGVSKTLAVHASKDTVIRRYSPDSVKFDDAKPGTLDQIKSGDQLRARGNRSPDGNDFAAEEIVSGNFRSIAGLILSVDPAIHTITVMDLATQKPVNVHITSDSQLRKLPAVMAQMLAMRLKGLAPEVRPAQTSATSGTPPTDAVPESQSRTDGGKGQRPGGPGGFGGGQRGGGSGDVQQMLNRMPPMPFSDFQKGDAVMIVTTQGSATSYVTAITLLSGVEAILTASPNGAGTASLLTPWSLGSSPGDATAVP